jgi:hypothetical protein
MISRPVYWGGARARALFARVARAARRRPQACCPGPGARRRATVIARGYTDGARAIRPDGPMAQPGLATAAWRRPARAITRCYFRTPGCSNHAILVPVYRSERVERARARGVFSRVFNREKKTVRRKQRACSERTHLGDALHARGRQEAVDDVALDKNAAIRDG